MNCAETESRPVLGPAGNKARTADTRKEVSKPHGKVEKPQEVAGDLKGKRAPTMPGVNSMQYCFTVPSILRKQDHKLLMSNLSLNASCSSDASSDSTQSRASTGRISGRRSITPVPIRRKQCSPKTDKVEKVVTDADVGSAASVDTSPTKKRCAWVTPNTDLVKSVLGNLVKSVTPFDSLNRSGFMRVVEVRVNKLWSLTV